MDAKQETMILFLKWLTISMEAQQLRQGAEHSSRNLCFEDQVLGSDKSDGNTHGMDSNNHSSVVKGVKLAHASLSSRPVGGNFMSLESGCEPSLPAKLASLDWTPSELTDGLSAEAQIGLFFPDGFQVTSGTQTGSPSNVPPPLTVPPKEHAQELAGDRMWHHLDQTRDLGCSQSFPVVGVGFGISPMTAATQDQWLASEAGMRAQDGTQGWKSCEHRLKDRIDFLESTFVTKLDVLDRKLTCLLEKS